jgi:hypothetical protein
MKFRCEPPTGGAGAVIHPVVIEEGQLDPVGTHKDPPFCFRFISFTTLLPKTQGGHRKKLHFTKSCFHFTASFA